jgi:YHS domain-containing protein/uncharacterized membrane protein YraQ (UPF0718 family)
VHALATASVLAQVGRSLREAFFMLWETLWALILGFTLSGVVQAFVPRERLQARLGSRRPAAVARAAGYGMASSSCSYAASAMSKSLFAKGADFVTAMVFMVASTNLVVELGLVLLVLMGWQFMAAEFIGGPIMIVLLALGGGLLLTAPVIARARRHLAERTPARVSHVSSEREAELEATPLSAKAADPAAWADASSYAVADVTMLRRELLIGYVVAGFLAVMVPTGFWNDLFLHGHGFWTVLENALVGPLIAVISWVCSIGNVPLAAALWSGGISFGGVIAFIFADLIAMPLILIYAKFYGWRVALRMVAALYVVMVIAGLATQGIFHASGWLPTNRELSIARSGFEWNYTTYLNLAFLVVAGGVFWLARNRARFGGGRGYAIDPVCGMQVRIADAPASATFEGHSYHFCSERCSERFEADPARFLKAAPAGHDRVAEATALIDPVCGMSVELDRAAATREHDGATVAFCSLACAARFDADPASVLASTSFEPMAPEPVRINLQPRRARSTEVLIDPVCGMSVELDRAAATREHDGATVAFCSLACAARFDAEHPQARALRHGAEEH